MEMIVPDNYKKKLISGLKKKYSIEVEESSLESVLSPNEFMQIINEYTPEDFSLGNNSSPELESFFKNVIDGNFRITLHNHTDFSDGRMTPEELINQAARYADKVALKSSDKKDNHPPFIIALTDHDEIKGSQEIIKLIAQNPEKYKNLKFIAGAEFGSKLDEYYFDITALCINPFDEKLNAFVDKQKDERTKTVKEFIAKVNALIGSKYSLKELEAIGFNGKKTLINKSGLVYVEHCKKIILKLLQENYGKNNDCEKQIKTVYQDGNCMNRDIPNARDVLNAIKEDNGFSAWTHPLRSFEKEDNLDWHKHFFAKLQSLGINGVEANHQYTYEQLKKIKDCQNKNDLYRTLAEKYNMFLSGGTDSHEYNIFAHHHLIDDKLLNKFLK